MKKILFSLLFVTGAIVAQAQADSLKIYTGKYSFPEGSPVSEITITIENGLLMAASSVGNTELKPTGTADVFEVVAYGGTATFKRKEGKVNALHVQVNDMSFEGEKKEGLALVSTVVLREQLSR